MPTQQTTGKRPGRWPQFSDEYAETIRNDRSLFQAERHVEIDRVATALEENKIFLLIYPSCRRPRAYWGRMKVKIAELVVSHFYEISGNKKAYNELSQLIGKLEINRNAYRKIATEFKKINPKPEDLTRPAAMEADRVLEKVEKIPRYLQRDAWYIDSLILSLVGILMHTTYIKPQPILIYIIPKILDVAWERYPDYAPATGPRNPRQRYIAAIKKILDSAPIYETKADVLCFFRALLFTGDERFPEDLFQTCTRQIYRSPSN